MSMKIETYYLGEDMTRSTHEPSGQTLETDVPVDHGGKGSTFSPMDLLACSLAACVMTVMGKVAESGDVDLSGASVVIERTMTTQPPERVAALKGRIRLPEDIGPKMRKKLMASLKVCPVHHSLHPEIEVEFLAD